MPAATRSLRAANLALLLVLPAPFLEGVSLTRRVLPDSPLYAALDVLGRDPHLLPVSVVFTAATLLGPVLAIALCLFAVLRLKWRSEPGA